MHEMSLCESVLNVIEQQAAAQHYRKVSVVWLEIGVLAGVDIEALRFCFEVVMRGSIADQAQLEIIPVSGLAWCFPCGQTVPVTQRYDLCPLCGNYQLELRDGDQMRIKELEVA